MTESDAELNCRQGLAALRAQYEALATAAQQALSVLKDLRAGQDIVLAARRCSAVHALEALLKEATTSKSSPATTADLVRAATDAALKSACMRPAVTKEPDHG